MSKSYSGATYERWSPLTASDDIHYSILGTINEDLTKISAQNRWVMTIYKQPNLDALDDCMNRLSNAMQKFTVRIWTKNAVGWGD